MLSTTLAFVNFGTAAASEAVTSTAPVAAISKPIPSDPNGMSTLKLFENKNSHQCSINELSQSLTPVDDPKVEQLYAHRFAELLVSGKIGLHMPEGDIRVQDASVNKVFSKGSFITLSLRP